MWLLTESRLCPPFSRSPGECGGPRGAVSRDGRTPPHCSLSAAWGRRTPSVIVLLLRDHRKGMVGQLDNVEGCVCVCVTCEQPLMIVGSHALNGKCQGWPGLKMSSGGGGCGYTAAWRAQHQGKGAKNRL